MLSCSEQFFQSTHQRHQKILAYYRNNAKPVEENFFRQTLKYVCGIDECQRTFTLCEFNTQNLKLIAKENFDLKIFKFDFLRQEIVENLCQKSEDNLMMDENSFQMCTDNGIVNISCGDEMLYKFDKELKKCIQKSPCNEDNNFKKLPLTQLNINRFVYNRKMFVNSDENYLVHPFMYMFCANSDVPLIESCPNNYVFNLEQCELKNLCENRPNGFKLSERIDSLFPNQYLVCENKQITTGNCPNRFDIFDIRNAQCVTAQPCDIYRDDFTYILNDIEDNQYLSCSNGRPTLITCPIRQFDGANYHCVGDVECNMFENGSGTLIANTTNQMFSYNSGELHCNSHFKTFAKYCEIDDYTFSIKPFYINGSFPDVVYNASTQTCEETTLDNVEFFTHTVGIVARKGNYGINFNAAINLDLVEFLKNPNETQLIQSLNYAKDQGVIGINPITNEEIKCMGETKLYDIFSGNRYNNCNDGEFIDEIELSSHEYINPTNLEIQSFSFINNPCRLNDVRLQTEIFTHGSSLYQLLCYYTLPIFSLVELDATEYNFLPTEDVECLNADLNAIINSQVILSSDGGCKSILNGNDIITKYFPIEELTISSVQPISDFDFESQSSDGIKYNIHLHKIENNWLACHKNLYSEIDHTCDTTNTIYNIYDTIFH